MVNENIQYPGRIGLIFGISLEVDFLPDIQIETGSLIYFYFVTTAASAASA